MFCHVCGNEVEDGATFCTNCGERLDVAIEVTPVAPREIKSSIFTKAIATKIGISLLLALLYVGISLIFIFILDMDDTILIKTNFDDDVYAYLTLREFLDVLVNGNRIFNPTIASTALGIGTYILIYSVPVFAGIALVDTFIRKESYSLHIVFSIMSVLSAVAVVMITPVSVKLISKVKQAVAIDIGVIFEDIKGFSFTKLIVFAVVVLILVMASGIVTVVLKKRRVQQ